MGARFGTDVDGTLATESGNYLNDFMVNVINRAIQAQDLRQSGQLGALSQLLGLGQNLAGTEFGRSENALSRALQEFLQTNSYEQLIALLTSGAI